MPPVNPPVPDKLSVCDLSMRDFFVALNNALVKIGAFLVLVGVVGCMLSVGITLWYVNSPNYCRDCDTGLGRISMGCIASWVVTPIGLYIRWFIKHNYPRR